MQLSDFTEHSQGYCEIYFAVIPVCTVPTIVPSDVQILRYRFCGYHSNCRSEFLGAFARLLKGIVSFVMPVCPSVSPHGTTGLPQDGFL